MANPLAAIALFGTFAGALTGFIIALGRAMPHITQAIRAWRGKRNGQNGKHVAEQSDDTQLVTAAVFDTTISGVHRRINEVSAEGREMRERMAIVEETCRRMEADVKALPGTVRELRAAQ